MKELCLQASKHCGGLEFGFPVATRSPFEGFVFLIASVP